MPVLTKKVTSRMEPFEFKRIRVSVLKMEQKDLAVKLDRHVVHISKYENGHAPIPAAIATLLRLLAQDKRNEPSKKPEAQANAAPSA